MKKKYTFKIIIVFMLAVLCASLKLHTYYVSICSIDYNTIEEKIEVSLKLIGHDFEKAIKEEYNIDLNLGEENQYESMDSIINHYIESNFLIKPDEKISNLYLIGTEFNLDESFYIYYETDKTVKPKELEISNTLLTTTFNQQENITYVNFGKLQQSHSFNKITTEYTYKIDE